MSKRDRTHVLEILSSAGLTHFIPAVHIAAIIDEDSEGNAQVILSTGLTIELADKHDVEQLVDLVEAALAIMVPD